MIEWNPVSSFGNGGNKHDAMDLVPALDSFDCVALDSLRFDWSTDGYRWRPGIDPQPSDDHRRRSLERFRGNLTGGPYGFGRGWLFYRKKAVEWGKDPEPSRGGKRRLHLRRHLLQGRGR